MINPYGPGAPFIGNFLPAWRCPRAGKRSILLSFNTSGSVVKLFIQIFAVTILDARPTRDVRWRRLSSEFRTRIPLSELFGTEGVE